LVSSFLWLAWCVLLRYGLGMGGENGVCGFVVGALVNLLAMLLDSNIIVIASKLLNVKLLDKLRKQEQAGRN